MEGGKVLKDPQSVVNFFNQMELLKEQKIAENPTIPEDQKNTMFSSNFFIKREINTAAKMGEYKPQSVFIMFDKSNDDILLDYCVNNAGSEMTVYQATPENLKEARQNEHCVSLSKGDKIFADDKINYYYEVENLKKYTKILVGLRSEEEAKKFNELMAPDKSFQIRPINTNYEKRKLLLEYPSIMNMEPKRAIEEIKAATETFSDWKEYKKFQQHKYFGMKNSNGEIMYFAVPFDKTDPKRAGTDYRDLICAKMTKELGDGKVSYVRSSNPNLQEAFYNNKVVFHMPVSIGMHLEKNLTESYIAAMKRSDNKSIKSFVDTFEKDVEQAPYKKSEREEPPSYTSDESRDRRPSMRM